MLRAIIRSGVFKNNLKELYNSPLNTSHNKRNKGPNPLANYYYTDVKNSKVRLICLDLYEVNALNRHNSPNLQKYIEEQKKKRYNLAFDEGDHNGLASPKQLDWLKEQLKFCKDNRKKVILAGHIPLCNQVSAKSKMTRCCNAHKILNIINNEYPGIVVLYLAGHNHPGGHEKIGQILHITMRAMLLYPKNENYFLNIKLYEKAVTIHPITNNPKYQNKGITIKI